MQQTMRLSKKEHDSYVIGADMFIFYYRGHRKDHNLEWDMSGRIAHILFNKSPAVGGTSYDFAKGFVKMRRDDGTEFVRVFEGTFESSRDARWIAFATNDLTMAEAREAYSSDRKKFKWSGSVVVPHDRQFR